MRYRFIVPLSIGFILILYSFKGSNTDRIIGHIYETNLFYIFVSVFIFCIFFFVYGFRWGVLIQALSVPPKLSVLTNIVLMGSAINCVIPGRAGDVARAYYLSEEKSIDFPAAFSTVFVEKFFDVLALFSLSLIFIVVSFEGEFPLFLKQGGVIVLIIILTIIILFYIIGYKADFMKGLSYRIAHIASFFVSFFSLRHAKNISDKVERNLNRIFHETANIVKNFRILLKVLFLSFFMWFLLDITCYIVVMSFSLDFPFSNISAIFFSGTLLGFIIPLTPGGMGTVEIIFSRLFSIVLDLEESLSLSIILVLRFITYWLVILVGGILIIKSSVNFENLGKMSS